MLEGKTNTFPLLWEIQCSSEACEHRNAFRTQRELVQLQGWTCFISGARLTKRIHWKWRTRSLKLGIVIFIVFVLNTIIVPFKSMDKGNQKGLTGDKRCVYTCNLIPCQIIYRTEEFISVNVIRYHYTKLIAGYIGSFKDINQHNFESNIIIPEDLKQQATDLFPSREG